MTEVQPLQVLLIRGVVLVLLGACRVDFDEISHGAYYNAVMDDHPVAYWRLGDHDSVARDEIGAYDGVHQGTYTEGARGALVGDPNPAVTLDGISGVVKGPDDALAFTGTAPFTLEVWIEPVAAKYQHFVTKELRAGLPDPGGGSHPLVGYALLQSPGVLFERVIDEMTSNHTGQHPIASGQWSHIVGTYDGATMCLYINGAMIETVPSPGAIASYKSPVLIGAHPYGANLGGSIDEVAIYDSALPSTRIATHYMIGSGP